MTTPTPFHPIVLRTHPKVLFWPAVWTAAGFAFLVAAIVFIPQWTDITWVLPAVAGIVLFVVLATAGVRFLDWRVSSFHVDAVKITSKTGFISRRTTEIPVHRLTQVSLEQGILDRIFGCGTLLLSDASALQGGIRFDDVPNVQDVQAQLNELIYANQGSPTALR